MSRKIADCRGYLSGGCTLMIAGEEEEEEVLAAVIQHAVLVHGRPDTAGVRAWLRGCLRDEVPAPRQPESLSMDVCYQAHIPM